MVVYCLICVLCRSSNSKLMLFWEGGDSFTRGSLWPRKHPSPLVLVAMITANLSQFYLSKLLLWTHTQKKYIRRSYKGNSMSAVHFIILKPPNRHCSLTLISMSRAGFRLGHLTFMPGNTESNVENDEWCWILTFCLSSLLIWRTVSEIKPGLTSPWYQLCLYILSVADFWHVNSCWTWT